jgi:23S rRNA pseudouridine2605 synthase
VARPRANAGGRRPGTVSLERALSKLGVASRAEARRWILAGRVEVGGRLTRDPNAWVVPERARIAVDGAPVVKAEYVYLALHKPAGIVTTRSDERGRKTVHDLLPEGLPPVFAVGRLDKDTSGLLLLTNDARWADRLTDPRGGTVKVYRVTVDHPLTQAARAAMEAPFTLPDGTRLAPARVRPLGTDGRAFEMAITEGKNRQIRRTCAALGYEVESLERIAVGPYKLGALRPGEVKSLTPE